MLFNTHKNLISSIFALSLLSSCTSKNNDISIQGTWGSCDNVSSSTHIYDELVLNNNEFQSTLYSALDNQCINIEQPPASVILTTGTYILNNPHISSSGLNIYNFTLIDTKRSSNLGTTFVSDFYNIVYIENERLHFGATNEILDGSSEEKRPIEINFERFYTKI